MSLSIESKSVPINLTRRIGIPANHILLVSADLQARVRLEAAVAALGGQVTARRPADDPAESPGEGPGAERLGAIVLDLDQLGPEGATRWARFARDRGIRLLGFFSHVDEELGRAATDLGIETFRRGRFWREALPILSEDRP